VRESASAGARAVFLALAPGATNGASFVARAQTQGTASQMNQSVPEAPLWLRLVRLGNSFSGYFSTDGQLWSAFGTATVSMNPNVEAGLALSSSLSDQPAQANFDHVILEPLSSSFGVWQNWMLLQRGVTNTTSIAPGADPDGDGRSNLAEYWLGSDPLTDDTSPAVSVIGWTNALVRLRFTERKNAASLGRQLLYSTDLLSWTPVTPASISDLQDSGSVVVREVDFLAPTARGFFRATYGP